MLGCIGAVTSSGGGSITAIHLATKPFTKFLAACEALRTNTEDYLVSILLLSKGAYSAYICDYTYTIAPGKATMLSAYLRWEGGNFAVSTSRLVLARGLLGLLWFVSLAFLFFLPVALLLLGASYVYIATMALTNLMSVVVAMNWIIHYHGSAKIIHQLTCEIMCLRSMINPFLGAIGGLFLLMLPYLTHVARHVPLQLVGVNFPWTIMLRAAVLTSGQGLLLVGILATDFVRSDVVHQVLLLMEASRNGEARLSIEDDDALEANYRLRGRLDDSIIVDLAKAWRSAAKEFALQGLFTLNQLTLQPGKGLMSAFRCALHIATRLHANIIVLCMQGFDGSDSS
jgi:hypothetical protein